MPFRYPIPDEELSEKLRANNIDPKEFFVRHKVENGSVYLQNYKTGDEIVFTANPIKRRN